MKNQIQGTNKDGMEATKIEGPSLFEQAYLRQLAAELEVFLRSKSVCTVKDIYLGFQGENYRGQMLIRKGA